MWYIIIPQAFKNVLPALGNEFIVLLKETSVAGYIALEDLTKGADIIRSQTYNPFMPLLSVAAIYLAIGTEDPLYDSNQRFRNFLKEQNADFRYEEGPGGHFWSFWNEYLPRGLSWLLADETQA